MRWLLRLVALSVTFLAPPLCFGQFEPKRDENSRLDKQLTQRWQVGVVIKTLGGPCAGLSGTIPVPTAWPEQEVRVEKEDVSPLVRRTSYRDLDGLRQLLFSVPQMPAGQQAQALVTLEVITHSIRAPENPEKLVIAENPPRDVRLWLGPSPMIDSRHNSIHDKAKSLTADKSTAWSQVEALYDWVRDNVKYQGASNLKGALETMRSGSGDKEDVTWLFIALCRAHKVPARTVWVPDQCYAEFYLQDAAGKGAWYPCQVAGTRDFGSMSVPRPILQKGDNFKVPEEKAAQFFVKEFLKGQGKGSKPPAVTWVRKLLPAN